MNNIEKAAILERTADILRIARDLTNESTRFNEVLEVIKLALLSDISSKFDFIEARLEDISESLDK